MKKTCCQNGVSHVDPAARAMKLWRQSRSVFRTPPLGASCLKQCVNMIERDRLKVERKNLSASYRRSLRDRQSKLYLFPRDSFEKKIKSSICSATADHSLVARFTFLFFFTNIEECCHDFYNHSRY